MRWLLVLLLCACGSTVRIPASPTLSIVDRGAEPRQLLRFAPIPGTTERAEVTIKQRLRTAYTNTVLEDGRTDVDQPSMRLIGPVVTENVSAAGAKITFTIETAEVLDDVVDARARPQVEAAAKGMVGSAVVWRRAANGATEPIAVPAALGSELFGDPTFPDEPVGIGASWRVTKAFTSSGVRFRAVMTYRLRDLMPSQVTLDLETDLVAPEQALSVEPNASVHLTSATGRGTGHAVIPLHSAIATSSVQWTVELNLKIVRGRLRVTSSQTLERVQSLRPAP